MKNVVKLLALVAVIFGMMTMALPRAALGVLGWEDPPTGTGTRVTAAVVTFVAFWIFSGPSKFGADDAETAPQVPVDHLVARLKASRPELVATVGDDAALRDALAHLVRKKKIAAIKAVRIATGSGLKEAKELVEEIQDAIRPVPA